MVKVGIMGATGYSGINLLALLLEHPKAEIKWITSTSFAGKEIAEVYPFLYGLTDLVCADPRNADLPKVDIVFVALPHGLAMEAVPPLLKKGIKVVDLGADFRLKDSSLYSK
ncbi:MAG: N-acetyl-gamma-glutamyl-phosphate reductase, partial [Candidatus Saganbacteria bacterium]|nr:N-acetyl-gamma-glutamyl-phosphate reductase [Candidatus Saganbacteria bacterium]